MFSLAKKKKEKQNKYDMNVTYDMNVHVHCITYFLQSN